MRKLNRRPTGASGPDESDGHTGNHGNRRGAGFSRCRSQPGIDILQLIMAGALKRMKRMIVTASPASPSDLLPMLRASVLFELFALFLGAVAADAQDATWVLNAGSDWTTAANWTPATVPTGTATFGASNTTSIIFPGTAAVNVATLDFNAGAPAYSFELTPQASVNITGSGIVNDSSNQPTFTIDPNAFFQFSAGTAGNASITINSVGGIVEFEDGSTAGSARIANSGGLVIFDNSGAGNAIITTNSGGITLFFDASTGGQARFITNTGGVLDISGLTTSEMTAGSIAGAGNYSLGSVALTVGLNNLSTEVSGTITDGGSSGGAGAALIKVGTGTLTLTGTNTYSGGTDFNGGTVAVDSDANLGPGALSFDGGTLEALAAGGGIVSSKAVTLLAGDGTFLADAGTTSTLSGPISGVGSLTNAGAGTLILTGTNSYSGGTTITAGTLQIGDGGTSGSIAGNVTNNAALVFNRSDSVTFGGSIGGTGSLTQNGSGSLSLTGRNTYAGNTNVNAGKLLVDGSLGAGSVNAASGATLGGTGTIGGPVTIQNGGILAPGDSPGTLTMGPLTLNSGSISNYQLGAPNVIGSGVNDLVNVNGNLTLAGTLNVANAGGFAPGIYRLFNYTGSLNDDGLTLNTVPSGYTAADFVVQTAQPGEVNLLVSTSSFTTQFWDGPNTVADATIRGGTGTWNNVTTNWTNANASANAAWGNGFAIFKGTAGTVTLGDNIHFTGMQFVTDGYTIVPANTQTLIAAPATTIEVGRGVSATIVAPIVDGSSPAAITKVDSGTLILTGTNTYTGGTTIAAGTLQIGNGGTTGSIVGHVTDDGALVFDRSDSVTFPGTISGSGSLTESGVTLTLTGTSSYTGGTTVNSGAELDLGTAGGGGNPGRVASIVGAVTNKSTFDVVNANTAGIRTITTSAGGETNFEHTSTAGTAAITNNTAGTTTFLDQSTAGNATITNNTGGVTQFFGSTSAGNATIITNNGGLTNFTGTSTGGQARFITNAGGVFDISGLTSSELTAGSIEGAGIYRLGSKTLVVGLNNLSTEVSGTIEAGSSSGGTGGSLIKEGTGTLTLSGANTYSGTELDAGTLIVANVQALGLGDMVVNGGILRADPQPINVKGNYTENAGGTLQLQVTGANPGQYDTLNVGGNATLGGTLQLLSLGFHPEAGNQLTLVTSGGVVTNRFAQFVDPFATGPGYSTVDLVYGLNSVVLEFLSLSSPLPPPTVVTIDFESFARTPNQRAAANLLDNIQLNPTAADLMSFLYKEPFTNLPGDFDKISPDALTAFYEISFSNANIQRLNLEGRLDDVRSGSNGFSSNMKVNTATVNLEDKATVGSSKNPVEQAMQPGPENRWGVWMTGFGDFVDVDADYNAKGYDFTTGGASLGIDYRLTDQLVVGVMGEYAHTWTSLNPRGHIDVDSGRGGVYASWFNRGFYLNGAIYGGHNVYDSGRASLGGLANGGTDGGEFSTFVSTGYDLHAGQLTVGPIASLQYTCVSVDDFTEKGSLSPLEIHSQSAESLRTDVGFRASYLWQVGKVLVEPTLRAAWEHEYRYTDLPLIAGFAGIPGPSDTFVGPNEGHDSAIVNAGVTAYWTPTIATYVDYDGQLGRDRYDSNAVTGGVKFSF
jgi:fibronectin-binding autotransporter adhesin